MAERDYKQLVRDLREVANRGDRLVATECANTATAIEELLAELHRVSVDYMRMAHLTLVLKASVEMIETRCQVAGRAWQLHHNGEEAYLATLERSPPDPAQPKV